MNSYLISTAVALSIDSLSVGVAYGVRKIRLSVGGWVSFLLTTMFIILLSAFAGKILSVFSVGRVLGSILLTITGLILIFQQFNFVNNLPLINLLSSPEKSDLNNNHTIDAKEAFFISLALTLDSSVASIGSVASTDNAIFVLPLLVMLFQPFFLIIGFRLGKAFVVEGCEKICSIIAGMLLLAIGLGGLIGIIKLKI